MKSKFILPLVLVALTIFGLRIGSCWADDLDDGISKATDDSIAADHEIGQPDKNIKYIITKAKSKTGGAQQQAGDGSGNMNSVVVGPGSNIKGDVIIIDQSKGPKTQVVE